MLHYLIHPVLFHLPIILGQLALIEALHLGLDPDILLSLILPPLLVNPPRLKKEIECLEIDVHALVLADLGVGDIVKNLVKGFLGLIILYFS